MSEDASVTAPPVPLPGLTTASPPKVTLTATVTTESAASLDAVKAKIGDPVVTQHTVHCGGETLSYTVTTGFLPINNAQGETEAKMFFMAYTKNDAGPSEDRPLMFSFNGGPGSSSVWLHLGALGPKRVRLNADGSLPPAPYKLIDNEHTWLAESDLVFIDPIGTGFSRASTPELGKKFWGVTGDAEAMGEFIRLFLTRNKRWDSPIFLVGESYGTTRAAALSDHLLGQGIGLNGIVLVSSVLNFQTIVFAPGNDLPYALYIPTYTAAAFYHKRLAPELQTSLTATLQEAHAWAMGEYSLALMQGDGLRGEARALIAQKLARYTGLSGEYVTRSDLRIEIQRFCKELLRSEQTIVGRLDSRLTALGTKHTAEEPEFDPSYTAIGPPYTGAFNAYVRGALGFEIDLPYQILDGGVNQAWNWGAKDGDILGYPDVSAALTTALTKNPHMKLFVASGYYDLATPYAATHYTLDHMNLPPSLRANIVTEEYEAGHMMYIHDQSLEKLARDASAFIRGAVG